MNFCITPGVKSHTVCVCCGGKPTPMKRFIAVLIIGGALAAANIYLVVSSIYDMGVSDAKKEFMQMQHIEAIELQKQNDSINILNQRKYEYE